MIADVDEFILYDDMQYTRRDWRNRNQIKTPQGKQWLTVPVKVKGKYHQTIRETEIDGTAWSDIHWRSITTNYSRAPYFREISEVFEPIYRSKRFIYLSDLNRECIRTICSYLGIVTQITNSWDYKLIAGKTERLADLCAQAGGTEYISGPAAKSYIEERCFFERGIGLTWFDYSGYPEYNQLYGAFTHEVSILDLLFNCGKEAQSFMKYKTKSEISASKD